MSILRYFQPQGSSLPNPRGDLALSMSSESIASANKEVLEATKSGGIGGKRGQYKKLDDDLRAEIGKYATDTYTSFTRFISNVNLNIREGVRMYRLNVSMGKKIRCRKIFVGQFSPRKYLDTKIKTSKIFADENFPIYGI